MIFPRRFFLSQTTGAAQRSKTLRGTVYDQLAATHMLCDPDIKSRFPTLLAQDRTDSISSFSSTNLHSTRGCVRSYVPATSLFFRLVIGSQSPESSAPSSNSPSLVEVRYSPLMPCSGPVSTSLQTLMDVYECVIYWTAANYSSIAHGRTANRAYVHI